MIRFWPWLFIAIPLIELYLIIQVGSIIGALWTVILVVLTAVIGVNLLRMQGFNTLQRAQRSMAQGQMPAQEMLEGMLLAIAGVLLLTPGFLTDSLGFLCLIPVTRQALVHFLLARVQIHGSGFQFQSGGFQQPGADQPRYQNEHIQRDGQNSGQRGQTIDGEFERKE